MHYLEIELSQQNLNVLITILGGLQVLDIIIAVSLYFIYKKDHHYLNAIFLWIGMFVFFLTDSYLGEASANHPLFSFSFAIISGYNISKLNRKLYQVKRAHQLSFQVVLILLAVFFRLLTPHNFFLISAPLAIAASVPILTSVFLAFINIRKKVIKTSIVDYIFIGISLVWGIHFLDYPFLRPLKELHYSFIGFSLALTLTYLLSILVPVVINRRLYLNMNDLIFKELNSRTKELAKAQSTLFKQDRLASMGSLVAGVAHEIKNPLNIINTSNHYLGRFIHKYTVDELKDIFQSNNQQKLQKLTSDRERFSEANLAITTSIQRADKIIKTMLGHARGDDSRELSNTNFNQFLTETIDLVERSSESKENITINKHFDSEIEDANIYLNDLRRVLINIIENGIYAIEEKKNKDPHFKGEIIISSKHLAEEQLILIKVSDNGTGIPSEKINHIFDPFMTTKPTGEGTGLGLSISQGIIKEHMGKIEVESLFGVGTSFYIYISSIL